MAWVPYCFQYYFGTTSARQPAGSQGRRTTVLTRLGLLFGLPPLPGGRPLGGRGNRGGVSAAWPPRHKSSHLAPRPLGPCGPGPVSFGRWMPFFPKGGGAYGDKAPLAPLRPWAPRTSDVRGLQKMPSLGAIITLTRRFSACPWGGWGFGKSPNALWPVPHDGHQLHPLPWSYYLPYLFGNFAHYIVQLALEP